jgi:hypothetical protein
MTNLTNFNRPSEEFIKAVCSFEEINTQIMKKIFFPCLLAAVIFMIFETPADAQDKAQKKVHVVIEENGRVTADSTVLFDKDASEQDIDAVISGISGEKNPPCHAHSETTRHCDTMADGGENETVIIQENGDIIIRTGDKPGEKCIKVTVECDGDTAMGAEKQEIMIIRTHDKEMASPEGCEKKVIEKKITVTEEGDKAEKTIILESPAETEKKSKKDH